MFGDAIVAAVLALVPARPLVPRDDVGVLAAYVIPWLIVGPWTAGYWLGERYGDAGGGPRGARAGLVLGVAGAALATWLVLRT